MATYLSTTFDINPGAMYELSMMNGKANIFFATNANSEDIYVGLGTIPREDHYETILRRNTTDVFGRPTMVQTVYFYNPSTVKVSLTVWYTFVESDNFPFEIMKNGGASGGSSGGGSFDGIITGVTSGVQLPVRDAEAIQYLSRIATAIEADASTNQTILEGINALLADL